MNLKPYNDGLLWELNEAYKNIPNIVRRANHCILLCREVLSLFRKDVTLNGFKTADDEIEFFKHIKSLPLTQYIYYLQIRSFELEFPKGNIDLQRKFIKKKLNRINHFFRKHRDFREYIESGSSHFDAQFYTRKYLDNFPEVTYTFHINDPEFNTPKDTLYAEFKAFNLCIVYLQNRLIDKSKSPDNKNPVLNDHISLQWTAPKSALTELIYALHYNRVINNGNTDIKEIALAMQQWFHFDLGDFYKTYSELKERKISRTKFLDDLAAGLESHMDKSEE